MAVVDLHERVARPVVLEALEVELEHGREVVEEDALARGLLPVPLGLVRVLALERLDLRRRRAGGRRLERQNI